MSTDPQWHAQRLVTGILTCLLTTRDDEPGRAHQLAGLLAGTYEECHGEADYLNVLHHSIVLACSAAGSAIVSHPNADQTDWANLTPIAAGIVAALVDDGQ